MPINLTEPAIRAAVARAAKEGKQIDLTDAQAPGLRLRASPGGTTAWNLTCRDQAGRMRRFPLGSFPAMSVAEARKRARQLRDDVKDRGADPVADRRKQRAITKDAAAGVGTLAALLDTYESKRGKSLKSWADGRRQIENVFKPFLSKPLASITKANLQIQADSWGAQHAASASVRYLRPILKWAAEREMVGADTATIRQPVPTQRRQRALSVDELHRLLPVLKASATAHAAAMRFALLTLARRDEIASARWRFVDFDAKVWTIPHTKADRPHRVPLSRQALAVLEARKPEKPKPDALIFSTGTGGKLDNWHRATLEIQSDSQTTGWHRHDLRRTAATLLGEMGTPPHVIEAALNHADLHSALAGIYNLARYQDEVAVALQKLADRLDGIEAGKLQAVPEVPA